MSKWTFVDVHLDLQAWNKSQWQGIPTRLETITCGYARKRGYSSKCSGLRNKRIWKKTKLAYLEAALRVFEAEVQALEGQSACAHTSAQRCVRESWCEETQRKVQSASAYSGRQIRSDGRSENDSAAEREEARGEALEGGQGRK